MTWLVDKEYTTHNTFPFVVVSPNCIAVSKWPIFHIPLISLLSERGQEHSDIPQISSDWPLRRPTLPNHIPQFIFFQNKNYISDQHHLHIHVSNNIHGWLNPITIILLFGYGLIPRLSRLLLLNNNPITTTLLN